MLGYATQHVTVILRVECLDVPHHEDRALESGLQCTRLNTWMLTHQLQVVEVRVGRRFPFSA